MEKVDKRRLLKTVLARDSILLRPFFSLVSLGTEGPSCAVELIVTAVVVIEGIGLEETLGMCLCYVKRVDCSRSGEQFQGRQSVAESSLSVEARGKVPPRRCQSDTPPVQSSHSLPTSERQWFSTDWFSTVLSTRMSTRCQ